MERRKDRARFMCRPDHPNHLNRAKHHDYHRPARYMITIMKAPLTPRLSNISGNPKNSISLDLTPAGQAFVKALALWNEQYPQIEISDYVVMPDHVHLCLNVHAYIKIGLSLAIGHLFGKSTSAFKINQIYPLPADFRFFSKGFNDRIAYDAEQWERRIAYVRDNPRRYLIKKTFPEYFRMRWVISVAGREYHALGNIFLLKEPEIHVVRFSRRYVEGEFQRRVAIWHEAVLNGGVLISPFIHPNEKDIRDYAIEEGGSVIRVCENGFAERYAPQGDEFQLMAAERLLLIGPAEYNSCKEDLTYNKAQSLNKLSEEIAALDWQQEGARIRPLRP